MKDCKKHYSAMYQVRMGETKCPWCQIEELKALISDSAPLCWANSGNTEEAYEWEKRAEKLLA